VKRVEGEVEGSAFSLICVGTNAEFTATNFRLITLEPMPQIPAPTTPRRQTERRRQIRGLFLLAIAVLILSVLRAGTHTIFTPGWWRLW
jgi:hypothetical protein